MICFERRSVWQSLLRLVPSLRRRQDAELEAAIARLVADPNLPCMIEGRLIPDGHGAR
jgi:hypothetical protein